MDEIRIGLKVVRDEDAADKAMKVLEKVKYLLPFFGYGWTYKGGVYVIYLTFSTNASKRAFDDAHGMHTLTYHLKDIDSAGVAACLGCRHKAACQIDPNLCGYWL